MRKSKSGIANDETQEMINNLVIDFINKRITKYLTNLPSSTTWKDVENSLPVLSKDIAVDVSKKLNLLLSTNPTITNDIKRYLDQVAEDYVELIYKQLHYKLKHQFEKAKHA
jgi:hypothetical protein